MLFILIVVRRFALSVFFYFQMRTYDGTQLLHCFHSFIKDMCREGTFVELKSQVLYLYSKLLSELVYFVDEIYTEVLLKTQSKM